MGSLATSVIGSARITSRCCHTSAACSLPLLASKRSWEEAYLTNLQSHPLESTLDRIRISDVVGIFTSEEEGPHEIARLLLSRGLDYFRIYVCENLGAPDERVTFGELEEILEIDFAPLNIVNLEAEARTSRFAGWA